MDALVFQRANDPNCQLHPSPVFEPSAFTTIRAFNSRCRRTFSFHEITFQVARVHPRLTPTYRFTAVSLAA